jgi:2-polyprenyl-6-methoxyphenol hydroxylase-like FAD-dependent oxidoreductase
MLPTLAQGAAMAVEDGYVLARCLDRHRDEPQAALEAYESLRRDFTARVQLQAREQFDINQSVPPKPRVSRDWLFAHDVTTEDIPAPTAGARHYDSANEV